MTDTATGKPPNPNARKVAISVLRAATAEYMVLSAPNTAPTPMSKRSTVPAPRTRVESSADCAA